MRSQTGSRLAGRLSLSLCRNAAPLTILGSMKEYEVRPPILPIYSINKVHLWGPKSARALRIIARRVPRSTSSGVVSQRGRNSWVRASDRRLPHNHRHTPPPNYTTEPVRSRPYQSPNVERLRGTGICTRLQRRCNTQLNTHTLFLSVCTLQ